MAPSESARLGSGTISDSSYSSTAPNPLHAAQAPRGLLNEKSAGDGARAGVSHALQLGCSVNRSRPASCTTTAMPFALLERRGDRLHQPVRRSAARLEPVHHDQELRHGGQVGVVLQRLEVHRLSVGEEPQKPSARRFSTMAAWLFRAEGGRGKQTW